MDDLKALVESTPPDQRELLVRVYVEYMGNLTGRKQINMMLQLLELAVQRNMLTAK